MKGSTSISVENRAIEATRKFFNKNGWAVWDVSHTGGEHAGYDFVIKKETTSLKIEVKGSEKQYYGIPDLYQTEVDESGKLVADLLCIVYFPPDGIERLAILARDDFPNGSMTRKSTYCIRSGYKNRKRIAERLIDLKSPWSVSHGNQAGVH